MLTYILKIAFRQMMKNKLYTGISIAGLSVAMASALLMLVYLKGEWNYDKHNQNPEEIYRVVFDNYVDLGKYATTPYPVGPALKSDFPEVDAMTRFASGVKTLVRFENHKFFENLVFVDTGFTDVFTMSFISGSPDKVLSAPNQIIISESLAKKYFGDKDPMGKTLFIGSSGSLNSVVTGVFRNVPQESHILFDIALPFSTFEKVWGTPSLWRQMPSNYTYLRLGDEFSATQLEEKLPGFVNQWVGSELENPDEEYQLALQPLLDIHLYSDYGREQGQGNLMTLYLLGFIAILVLLIAGINYINYATASFVRRIREVSIRKIIGADRIRLIGQFMGETFIIIFIAGILSLMMAEWWLPAFSSISGKHFQSSDLQNPWIYLSLLWIIPALTLLAGMFPAVFLSGFSPVESLKGKFGKLSFARLTRKGMIVFQFACAVILFAATFTVWRQMDYIRNSIRLDSGQQVAVLQLNSRLAEKYESVKQELLRNPSIQTVSAGSNMPTFYGDSWPVMLNANSQPVQMENYSIQDDFLEAMGYELLAGRELSSLLASDVEEGIILNRTAVRSLGIAEMEEALGETVLWGGDKKWEKRVVGVVEDFHFQSFHQKIEPAVLQFAPYEWMTPQFLAIRFDPEAFTTVRQFVKETVEAVDPNWYAELHYFNDNFLQLHANDRQLGNIFGAFALLAIFISSMGLFGLAAFSAVQRTKEVGIRKVLGASVSGIVRLLSRDFLKMVGLAFILAVPVAWIALNRWLEGFAYSSHLTWWIFAVSGLIVLGIASFTVGIQGLKTALMNPVNALRTE